MNTKSRVLAILQARVSSTRLPGKVLRPILGRPMLFYQLERVLRSERIDKLVVATSTADSDGQLEDMCRNAGIDCFRGNLENVLDRYLQCARKYDPEIVVRLTGDCPLADPTVIDRAVDLLFASDSDYVTNTIEPSFPHGLDVEVIRLSALTRAWREATLPSQKEHVTPYIWQHPQLFKISVLRNDTDLSHLRWTVDEPQDFELVKIIYEALYPDNPQFDTGDILEYLEQHPELSEINAGFERLEGYRKSLHKDKEAR